MSILTTTTTPSPRMRPPTPERAAAASNVATEQLTAAGRAIEHDSFAVIDREVGPHAYDAQQWPIVRRMIHANADFDFNGLTDFHPRAVEAGVAAVLGRQARVVADVEMICVGLSRPRLAHFGMTTHQFISDADVIDAATQQGTTRAVQALRKAHKRGLIDGAIVGIGNAPTALIELARLIADEGASPALVVGMPVGFVSAAESKDLIASQDRVPWIVIRGRKGGSTLVVAAIHALLGLAEAQERAEEQGHGSP
jgi:precorrin-8X/cobalt-precorrin-8 methylmutase